MFGRFATWITVVFGLLGGGAISLANQERGAWQWHSTALQLSGARTLRRRLLSCDVGAAWTEDAARAWWQQHGAPVREARQRERDQGQRPASTGRSTVAVDLRAREH